MAHAFGEQGMNLALADINAEALDAARQSLEVAGYPVLTLPLDITDREACRAAVAKTVERFSALHLVCVNAGVSGDMTPLQEADDKAWDWVIDVNLKGSINTLQACLPHIRQHPGEGHIVITSSISGLRIHRPSRGQGMYNTTKFALMGLGEALALDLEPEEIGVTLLCPGVVNTNITYSGQHRQARYGGATSLNEDHELGKAALNGTDPQDFGRWVVKAVEEKRLFFPTHAEGRDQVEQRHRRIEEAFDNISRL